MDIIMLIFTILLVVSAYKPSMLKLNTLKKSADKIMEQAKNDKTTFTSLCAVGIIFSIVYCIILAFYVNTIQFTFVMGFWIAQSMYELNIMNDYINKSKATRVLNSVIYKVASKVIDLGIYAYLIYFIVIHW